MMLDSDNIFISDQKIDKSTILINANFKTHNKFLKLIRLENILPVTYPVSLEIYFENLYNQEIEGFQNIAFYIEYPDSNQIRPWKLNVPKLKSKGDSCTAKSDKFFVPEVPGIHRLVINEINVVQYADYHGISGRPYKLIDGNFISSFYIYSALELRFYFTAFSALIISLISLAISAFM